MGVGSQLGTEPGPAHVWLVFAEAYEEEPALTRLLEASAEGGLRVSGKYCH